MTAIPRSRAHLIERAVEAMGRVGAPAPDAGGVQPPPPPPAAAAAAPAASPAPSPVVAPPPAVTMPQLTAAGLVVSAGSAARSRLGEEIAIIQHHLMRTLRTLPAVEGHCNRIVLVTSSRPNEGKSFVSLNLSVSIAIGRSRPVLLVDVDGKSGSISDLLGVSGAPGMRLLAHDAGYDPAALALPTAVPRLGVVPFGVMPSDGVSVPPGSAMAAALMRLAAAMSDHVLIVDSPPCLSTSDPSSLASVAGQVLMIVEAERTQRNELEASLDMVDACPNVQLVLNRAQVTGTDSFGAYGYGTYGYGAYGSHGDSRDS